MLKNQVFSGLEFGGWSLLHCPKGGPELRDIVESFVKWVWKCEGQGLWFMILG